MLNDVTQLEQEIKALEKEKEYFKDWCKVYESRIETKDHIINQLETNKTHLIEIISGLINYVKSTYNEDLTDRTAGVMEIVLNKKGGSNE